MLLFRRRFLFKEKEFLRQLGIGKSMCSIFYEANLSWSVIKVLWILNILTCTNSMMREKRGVSWNMRGMSSSWHSTGTILKFLVLVTVLMTLPLRLAWLQLMRHIMGASKLRLFDFFWAETDFHGTIYLQINLHEHERHVQFIWTSC